ncbi:hypothetical protein KDL44_04155 [bacterium]|nr:hypothetical protein [bacterium]
MRGFLICIGLWLLTACSLALAQQGPGQSAATRIFGVHISGTIRSMSPTGKLLEERQYICQRTCYPAEQRFVEHYMSWVGEDVSSLREWEYSYELDGQAFSFTGAEISEGQGSVEGRNWSWDEIDYTYSDAEGLRYSFSGEFSGRDCQRAGVVQDKSGSVLRLIADESSVITEEEFAILQAVYMRIKSGHN